MLKIFDDFFCVNQDQINTVEARDCQLRTVEQHNTFVEELESSDKLTVNGVKKACVLHKHLFHFHPVSGFPLDILHDFFEGVIPTELCLFPKDFVSKGFITSDGLNSHINQFLYKHSDKDNKPKQITKASVGKKRISGNRQKLEVVTFVTSFDWEQYSRKGALMGNINGPQRDFGDCFLY